MECGAAMFSLKDLFKKNKQLIGLDIGSRSLKMFEIIDTPKGYHLSKFQHLSLPRGVIVNGEIARPSDLTEALKELHRRSKCSGKEVVTSLSGNSVVSKKVNFNQMSDEELRELLTDEGSKYLPFEDMSRVYLDFQILKGSEVNPNQVEVLLAAAQKAVVHSYTEAVAGAGLAVVIMDVDTFALGTMYEENYDFEEEDLDFIVNIGASITNINAVKGGVSIFTRDFVLGGNLITEALERKLGVGFDEAEKIKIAGKPQGEDQDSLKEEMLAFADPILTEVERSLDYFKSRNRDYIKHVIVSGGTAKLPGIVRELEGRLGIPTEIANPFKKLSYNDKTLDVVALEELGPQAAVGIGLALRRLEDK